MGNNTLSYLAGSETWTQTMAKEFMKLGHSVSAYSPELGLIATKMEADGVTCTNNIDGDIGIQKFSFILEPEREYPDVIICNHNHIASYLRKKYPTTPMICTIHGIIHLDEGTGEKFPEHPAIDIKVDKYIAVSEEVQEKLKKDYGLDSDVIRNGFDLERFKYAPNIKDKPKVFFINSNYNSPQDEVVQVVVEVAKHYDAAFQGIGVNFTPTYEVEKVLADVDVVVGMGRSLIEGVAMGKLGICHGRWGTGGVLNKDNITKIAYNNYSGRNSGGKLMTKEEMIKEIDKYYNKKNIKDAYDWVKFEHDVVKNAKEYIDIAYSLIK